MNDMNSYLKQHAITYSVTPHEKFEGQSHLTLTGGERD